MLTFLLALGAFLAEHGDLIDEIMKMIEGGMTKADILQAIKEKQIALADAAVAADLGPRP